MVKANAEKQAYWQSVLRRQQESGVSIRQFCKDQDVPPASFYSWKRKLTKQKRRADSGEEGNGRESSATKNENAAVFIPVRLGAATGGVLEVVHPRGHVVRVPALFDENSLRQVLCVLDGREDA